MKFAKIVGLPLTIIGLVLYSPPLQRLFEDLLGEMGRITGAVVFASGWSLLLGYLAFNLGVKIQNKKLSN